MSSIEGNEALSGFVKTAGVLVSVAATIVATWGIGRRQRAVPEEYFKQARQIVVVATAVFVALMFVFLASPDHFLQLGAIAGGALISCVFFFLWNVATTLVKPPSPGIVITYLATFIFYATSGSVALSAAALLFSIKDPGPRTVVSQGIDLTSSASPTAATSPFPRVPVLSTSPAPTPEPSPAVHATVSATAPPAGSLAIEYEVHPFEASSGQVNLGCEETRSAIARYNLPTGAEIVGPLAATWRNTDNAQSFTASARQIGSSEVVAEGAITGLARQHILGIGNCPGGGHGEIVLSGTFRRPKNRQQ